MITLKEYIDGINIWLDDIRKAPKGFIHVKWPNEVIDLIKKYKNVNIISLDHDLGDDKRGTGYDVLLWIEEQAYTNSLFKIPNQILVHSDNTVAKKKMLLAIQSINKKR